MFTLSPGVSVSEIDAATGIPAVSTTVAGMAGVFRWGPVSQRVLTTSEPDLTSKFQKPTTYNAETWFTAANFLGYGNQLIVIRVSDGTSAMAVFSGSTAPAANTQTILNKDDYDSGRVTFSANCAYIAKYPGALGNSLRVSVCDSAAAFNTQIPLVANGDIAATSNVSFVVGSSNAVISIGFTGSGTQATANAQAYAVSDALQVGDNILVGNSTIGTQYTKISSIGAITGNSTISTFQITLAEPYRLHTNYSSNTVNRFWEFRNLVSSAPGISGYSAQFGNGVADEVHVVVVDDGGAFSGSPGAVLETFAGLSRATDAKTLVGATNYYKDVINTTSKYIWWANDRAESPSDVAASLVAPTSTASLSVTFQGGTDGSDEGSIALSYLAQGYDLLADASTVDVSFILGGKSRQGDDATKENYIIDNVTEARKDCVGFFSPPLETVVNNAGYEMDDVLTFAGLLRASSYGFLDSGYKYQYDKYNDVYRWIPLNGDIAGLCVRTDYTNDAWWSPAGYNRGQINNVTNIAWNPNRATRDILSQASVNAVIRESGEGTILFDDRTLLKQDSPFRALNIRRLFIVLEKAIATDAKYMLFEFNDEFTQAQFRNRVVPYLRDIQGRRGITDFQVICDSTNNTAEIVDAEEFVGDIYIKPNRVIRSIQLNFTAVRGDVAFNEIVGQS